jgi:hypothetical protein
VDQPAPAAAQRVCPHCARISYATGRVCPYCGRAFRRWSILPALAAMLVVFAIAVLGGFYVMLVAAGDELDERLDREADRIEREFDGSLRGIERDIREELDRRLPETAAPTP